jgi:peptidylprolyl isomerase
MSSRRIAEWPARRRAVALLLLASLCGAAAADPVIAERGQDRITVSQARAMIAAVDPDTRRRLTIDPNALKEFLRNVLVQRAVLAQAQAEKWEQRPDVANLLARTREQVVVKSYLAAHAMPPPAFPSEAEIKAAYEQNKAQFMQPRGYHLVQLFVPKPAAGAADDGKRRLAALRTQIERGHLAMADAAKHDTTVQYTDPGWVTEKQLLPSVKDAVLGLQEGGMTDPLCVENGCHLIRLLATRPAGPTPLLELREGLIRAMRQQKQADLERVYASGLLAKQPVAIDEIQLSRMAP